MIEEIKRKLKGNRVFLKCINKEGFISKNEVNKEILNLEEIEVEYYQEGDGDFFGGLQLIASESFLEGKGLVIGDMFIRDNEIEYFEIIESSYIEDSPTFDDLIDTAVKAYKDGVIDNLEITKGVSSGAGVRINGNRQFTNSRPKDGINFINSLYTETFVIESEEDTLKIDTSGSEIIKVILANNEVLSSNYLDCLCDISDGFRFKILKGATVTQKRCKQ